MKGLELHLKKGEELAKMLITQNPHYGGCLLYTSPSPRD